MQEDRQRVLALKKQVGESLVDVQRAVDPNLLQPRQDDVVEFRETGSKAVADAALCLGQITGERLRDRAYIRKWDVSRRGNDLVLVSSANRNV